MIEIKDEDIKVVVEKYAGSYIVVASLSSDKSLSGYCHVDNGWFINLISTIDERLKYATTIAIQNLKQEVEKQNNAQKEVDMLTLKVQSYINSGATEKRIERL